MFSGYKDATPCYNDQPFFENRSQASFLPGDTSKQTSGPPWDYSQQPFSTVPCYTGDQNMNHRHPAAIHNPQVASQFENNSVLAHYKNISTGNNSHQSVVRPRAVINCQSNCNACYNHSVARVPHPWNPPPAESICYITGNSAAPLSGDEISRFAPNLANFSQHEESSHHFTSGFATQLTKLSKFPKDSSPGISSTIAPKNNNLSPTEDSSVVRPQHCPSRVEPILEKYIPSVPSENTSTKKDSCITCRGVCTRPNCKLYHQQTIKFPNLEPLPIQQYGVPRENVLRYTGHSATTLNGGSPSCNQWHQSPGLWLQNSHPPSFWMSASDDIHNMGNAGMTNFWSDRNNCEISGQQVPLPPNYHDMASNKPAGQVRNHLSLQQQKEGIVHEGERSDKLHQSMLQRYQKGAEVPQRYSEMSARQKGPEETAVSQVYQELLPRRSHQREAVVECGVQYRQDMVSRHPTRVVKSQVETRSNKSDRGRHEPPTVTSELCHQGISRSHISSDGVNSSPALPEFPPTSVDTHTDQVQRDISRKFPATNFAAYLPHDTKVSSSSSSNYSAVLGIAQPPSRFSSNLTYTQSKISRSNNYMRLFSEPCLEESYNPSHSGDVLRNGFVSNSTTATANTVTSGLSHRHISYHNRETPNTGMNCSGQIQSPSSNSLPIDPIIRYGTMKDSSDTPPVTTTSASVAASQISPHLQSCGKMLSDNAPQYQTGSRTMQVVESNTACSLGSSAGLTVDPKLLNNSSYIDSPHNRRESGVAGSQHMPYQNMLAGNRSEDVAACNTFCGNNSSVLHSHLFNDFSKNYTDTHVSGPEADMISQSSKESCQITSPNIYSQSNMSTTTGGLKQQLLPLIEDIGGSRPIKKRKPRIKGMMKPDQVQLVGKRWHRGRNSQQMTPAPVLDVRQFLATWDEETDDLSPAPRLPDVVLSNSSAENPLLVLDCRNLNTNGMATLSTVDRNSLPEGSPTKSLIHMYEPQLASPSDSSNTSNDTTKSNTQTLQENSSDDISQPLGECPSLIPIDPDRMEKFGQPNNCIKSLPEHRALEQRKSSFYQTEESGKSTPNSGSVNSVSKSGLVESLVEAPGISVVDNIHNHLDNVCTKSDVSDSIPLDECHNSSKSLPLQTEPLPEECDSFHGIQENNCDIDSQHCFVVQDKYRTNGSNCQNAQGKSKCKSKDCDCFISHQEVSLSCSKIQQPDPNTALEEKHADFHQSRTSRAKEMQSLVFKNRIGINTLKALCAAVIERSTKIKQTFEKGRYSHGKTSNRGFAGKEIEVLETELCDSLNADKEVEKTWAENGCSVLKNIADISCGSDHSSIKDVTIYMSESAGMPSLIDETNDVSDTKISLCSTLNSHNKVLSQETENTNETEKYLKLSLTCELLGKEKLPENTNACTTEVSHSESSNLTNTVNTEIAVNRSVKLFDEALPPSSFKMKTLNEDILLNTDVIPTDSPDSPYLAAEKLSSMHLPQDRREQGIAGKASVMANEEKVKLKEQDLKSYSTEPVETSENERGIENVNFSVTHESENNHLNLLSYSSDSGEDLDMSVTSSTPTPVIVEEVDEESGNEEFDLMYQDSALSDLESEIRLESDCISFSSLPCISKNPIHEDNTHSNHSLDILESLDRSRTLTGGADDSFPCVVEENFDSENLSENKDEVAGMCDFKISGKTDNEKCVSVSSSHAKSLGNNTELSPYFKSSLDIPDSCSPDTQIQPIKSQPSQLFTVNHESDSLSSRIKDVSKSSDLTSDAGLLDVAPESDEKVQSESEENNYAEFLPLAHNSAVEACNILHGHKRTTNVLLENTTCSDSGTKIDCVVISKPVDCEKHDSSDSLLSDTLVVTADSNQQNKDDNSVDKTLPSTQSNASMVLYEELGLKLAENKVNPVCAEKMSLDASGKHMSASAVSYFNGGHSLVVGDIRRRQRKDCLILNNNSVMLRSSSSSSDNPACHDSSELAVSHDVEERLETSDEIKDSKFSTNSHTEIHFNYGPKQLEIEETGNEVSEVYPLQKKNSCELLELSENDETANKSILETTADCSKNITSCMRVLETSPFSCESVEVIQPSQLATDIKEMPNSLAVCNKNAESPAVHHDCNSNSPTPNVAIRSEDVSQINENNIDGHVPCREDDSDLCIKLNIATSQNYNNSIVLQASENQNVPKTLLLQNQNFCGLNGEDKLLITAGGNEYEQTHKMNSDRNNSIEEPQNKNLLFITGAKSAPIQDNIINSQQTAVLNSSAGHSETSDESVSEAVPHDHLEINCEPECTVTRIPCEGTAVAGYETLLNVEPINSSRNTISKWQEGTTIPEDKLSARSDRSPFVTESQNVEYLQRNFGTDICHNERKNGCREDDVAVDDYRNTSCKGQNVARSVTDSGGGGGDDDSDDDDDDNDVTTTAATINGDDHDDVSVKSIVALTEEHLDDNYHTDTHIADVTGHVTTTTTTTAAAAAVTLDGVYCDNTDVDDDGGGGGGALNPTTSATSTDDEADTSRNMDTYTSCKDQSNVPCQNLVQNVTDLETIAGITATTTAAAAATTTTTTTTTTTITTTTITTTTTAAVAATAATTTTADGIGTGNDANTDDEDEVCVDVTTGAAAATTTTTTAVTTITTSSLGTAATATFAAAISATAVNTISSGDIDDVNKGLVNCAVGEDWQHGADIQCINTSQMASRSQNAEQNDTDMEQRHITIMVTSGSITLEKENTAKMSLGINTLENQEFYQPEGKLETAQNFRLEQPSKSSSEYNHNQLLKLITTYRAPKSPDDLSCNSKHIEYVGIRKPLSELESTGSKSQQQEEASQERIRYCELDTAANHMKPLQQQCQSAAEPTKDVVNNYMHELHDESCALSVQEECPYVEEMLKDKINNCVLDMSSDVPMQQEEHHCLEELIKDEICNSEVTIPSGPLMQHEWNSTDKVIKDEISSEINITSVNAAIPHECHSSLDLNKEEIGDFKIKTPEHVSHSFLIAQDPSEGLDSARIAKCVLRMSADSSLKEEHLSIRENNNSILHSGQSSPISGPGLVHNTMTTLASTKMTVELMHSRVSAQDSPYRQEDLSVGTEDMPHLEVIDTEVSPYSSDSLEMPCLDLITDPVQPVGSDQVQYPNDICASASNIPPLHSLPVDMDTGVKENLTESGVDVQAVQRNDNPTLEVTFSSSHSVHKSEGSKDTEMSVPSQDQVTDSVDCELLGKQISSMLTTSQNSFGLERRSSTEDSVVQKEPLAESHSCEKSSRLEREASTMDGVIQKEPSAGSHGLSPSLDSDVLQNDQHKYLPPEAQVPVTEECDGALEKAVECEMQEVSVTPETLQVLATYLDSEPRSVKVVEVEPEYMEVLQSDAARGWESLPLVTSDLECAPSGEKSQKHTTDVTADEEVLASTAIGKAWPSVNLDDETSLSSAELSVCRTETNSNIAGDPMYSAAKETKALISEHSDNVTITTAALQDTSDEPSSAVYSEMLPGLDPSLGDVLPVDSVSNWPYLEEEVFSEFPAADMDSSNSLLMVSSSSPVPSIPTSSNGDTAESEASMSSGNSSQYNFRTQSSSNDAEVAINSLKCRLSWKKIFALSKAHKKKKKKQGTKNGENPKVTKEDTEFCTKSRQQFKEYSKTCHANDGNKLGDKYETLSENLKSQLDLKNKGVSGLELGPAKIEVRLAPIPSPRGHLKTWQVVDGPKSEKILNHQKPNNILLNTSAGNSCCRSVAKDVGLLPNGVTQSPIVLVKRLILKRRSDDDSDADSDTKSKNVNQEEALDPNIRNLNSNNFIQVSASSEQTSEACDVVAPCCEQLEDSEHTDSLLKECDLSNSSLMTSISSSQQTETQAGGTTDNGNSESEEDGSSHASVVSNSQEAGGKYEVCKSGSSSSITLSEENDTDGIEPSVDTAKTHDICIDDSKHGNIYSDISFNELGSTNSSFSGEDNTKQQLPRVIIKRTVGMGNTNKYRSFLRSASSCSTSGNQWQPIVRLERNLSLDEFAKSSAMNNEILETAKVPDNLRHGLKISLRSPPSQHHVTLVPLPSLACSSVDGSQSHSQRSKKQKFGMFPPRINARCGNLKDSWNRQRYARRFTPFKSSFCVKYDTCPSSLHNDSGQLSSPKSHLSQKSPPIKLKFFSNYNRMQNGALKMDRTKAITGDSSDEYIVVENRNYTRDSMTKITFQRHKRKEVSVRKECRNVEIKEREFVNNEDIPTALNQNSRADMVPVHGIPAACSEDSNNNFNVTTYPHGIVKRRLSVEHGRESSKTEHHSHKKHMSDVSHDVASSKQKIAAALEDTGNMMSEDFSRNKTAMLNDKPSTLPQPAVQSVTASKDYGPKSSAIKKRRYFEDIYLEKDVPPLFQPERILSVSSTKKKRTSLKERSPQMDGKALEEEIRSLSAETQMDYSEIIYKELTEDTDVEAKERQDFPAEGSSRMLPCTEECARETGSCKDAAPLSVSSSEEPEPKLHKLNDCGSECVGNSSALKAGEHQILCNNVEHSVVESPTPRDDACQACGLVYNSHDERTAHIRRHPYHCQRCHLAFRSEVDFVSHLSEQHPRTRERHHCLLCERSFPTAERYRLHLSGRTHHHLELTQRRTIHTLFSIFTGHNCPVLTPLSDSELAGLKWFPVEPGTIHFYHQATPLQHAMQDLLLRKEGNFSNTARSNFRIPEDYPSKSSDSL